MVQKSYGKMRGTRQKMRVKRKTPINAYLQKFKPGEHVHIDIISSSPLQHPRFQGLTGVILEKRGRSYVVQVKDGNKLKQFFSRPEHLRLQKNLK